MKVKIREADFSDLERINEIYNYYVVNSTCTYQRDPVSMEERIGWFQSRSEQHPVVVAQESNQIVGWGSISSFKKRSAYENTGEVAVYIDHRFHRRGIGTEILKSLLVHAKKSGLHTLVAAISADQEQSLKLHEKLGFKISGRMAEVGYKFDRWLDVIYMQYMIKDM
ncbi:N-acetyltransferase family protein [bacterium]|nr:N-acetyltransferase family protein [bacterium]